MSDIGWSDTFKFRGCNKEERTQNEAERKVTEWCILQWRRGIGRRSMCRKYVEMHKVVNLRALAVNDASHLSGVNRLVYYVGIKHVPQVQ